MKSLEKTFEETIKQEIARQQTNVFALEQAAGLAPDAIRNVLRSSKKSGPTLGRAKEICDALGLEFYIGPKRHIETAPEVLADDNDFVKVNRYDVALSAGDGRAGDNAAPLAPIAFRANWMRDHGLVASNCCVVSVSGDSMEPALRDGDLVLVDQTDRPIRNMGIYAFSEPSGDVKVKRLEKDNDHLIIKSDNPIFTTTVLPKNETEGLKIIGKVIWAGHEFK